MPDDASNLISVGSFLFSGIALLVSINANRKANAIKQRQIEIEEQREKDRQKQKCSAQLRSELRKDEKNNYRLCIVNQGAAEARNVRVIMDGKPLSEHAASIKTDGLPALVGANSEMSCSLRLAMGLMPPFKVEVVWDDDSGADNKSNNTLTRPSK